MNIVIIVVLITLMLIRLLSKENAGWITTVNFVGLVIAVYSFLVEFSSKSREGKNKKCFNFCKGLLLIVIVLLAIVACFIFTGGITVSSKGEDEVLLLTLLISLPAREYSDLIVTFLDKERGDVR